MVYYGGVMLIICDEWISTATQIIQIDILKRSYNLLSQVTI